MTDVKKERDLKIAQEFLSFTDASKSPFHATESVADILRKNGFEAISETEQWQGKVKEGGRYYFTRDGSSIIAFAIDQGIDKQQVGMTVIGAHTDSPCFKVKPVSKKRGYGYLQVGVECYGGGLWHTWFDRDLTVAGRVVVKTADGNRMHLVCIEKPILRIPNLAIHLSRNVNAEGFRVNKETDTTPVLATEIATALNTPNGAVYLSDETSGAAGGRHHPLLLELLGRELNVNPMDIIDIELCVSDTQPGAIGGGLDEFVFAPRLDNLGSCFSGARSLVGSLEGGGARMIRMLGCFDHEEVGSQSSKGADSPLLTDSMKRICEVLDLSYEEVVARSLLVSADMAHGIHPNYASRHEVNHRPLLGGGLVIKTNQNQRYSTSGISGFIVREAARRAGNVAIQEFVVPNDRPCGSTIGPILSSRSGLRTVDVGQAQLSMHSIREMCAVKDFYLVEQVLTEIMVNHKAIMDGLGGYEIER